ncbi:DNA polymerase/3'-5' exonuclease PolX [Lewinellaceae bacterium SD302]|nr:DNA polymerase/3'-5' exonuclease PolX [Lewinellaceae bacterium SD302]
MTNPEIARAFQLLGKIMELHGDNPFKIRSYSNAYMKLRKLERPLADMSLEEISAIPGVGKAITEKIDALRTTGSMPTLDKWLAQTPPGVVEMLGISGFGPKKVKAVWEGLGVESIGELLYAVNENRLVELKGFGAKTQASLKKKLEFVQRSSGQFHYRTLEVLARQLFAELKKQFGEEVRWAATGALRRRMPTLTEIELITDLPLDRISELESFENMSSEALFKATYEEVPVIIYPATADNWGTVQFERTGSSEYVAGISKVGAFKTEAEVFAKLGLEFVSPELREAKDWLVSKGEKEVPKLLEESDIKGVVHSHSTYSDGINSLREMAVSSRDAGYEYLLITDHSKSAFYANGLKEDRLREQWAEVDALNLELAPFRILKGIESDILNDGSLDYPDEVLAGFDVIIASIHSNLGMDKEKATERLITAIKNPYTHILGHPTGRLLLSREGYPIDHLAVIEACAEHGVCIELNANPYRLDLDWSWIPVALEKGVPISVNPDAHSVGGIHDIRYGVLAARKGGLTAEMCLNTRGVKDFLAWFGK